MITSKDFFKALYQEASGHLTIWTKREKKTRYLPIGEWDRAEELAEALAQNDDVYFGVALQDREAATKDNPSSRGSAETATALPGLFMDIDVGTEGHSGKKYPPTKEAAIDLLRGFPILPTLIVHTGGGLHAYWLFKEPWVFETPEERQTAKELSRRFQQTFIVHAGKKGFTLDNTSDLARLLRVPGTFNHKTETPRPVEVIEFNSKNRAEPSEFDQYLVEDAELVGGTDRPSDHREHLDLKQALEELKKVPCEFIQSCIEKPHQVSEPLWFALIGNVARFLQKGAQLCHEVSRGHPGYRKQETDAKILHAMDCPPHTCQYIRDNGFKCSKTCSAKSPAGLWARTGTNRKVDAELDLEQIEQEIRDVLEKIRQDKSPKAAFEEAAVKNFRILSTQDPRRWAIMKEDFKRLKVPMRDLERLIKGGQSSQGGQPESQEKTLMTLDTRFCVPAGYALDNQGTFAVDANGQKYSIAPFPVWVSGRIEGLDDRKESLELSWKRAGRIQSISVPRKTAMDANSLIELANDGFPVHSENKTRLAGYLTAFESQNIDRLPTIRMATQLGWVGKDGSMGFLLGRTHFPPNQEPVLNDITDSSSKTWVKDGVIFGGPYSASGMLADSLQPGGNYDEWRDCMKLLTPYPIPQLLVYASCVPPLLELLGVPNFGLCLWQDTSLGKSISLETAASVWGQPTSKSEQALINSWNVTKVFFERSAAVASGIPLYMDDTKEVKAEDVDKLLYTLGNGIGRGRGNLISVQKTSRWNTVLLTTGEGPISGFIKGSGARVRCFDVYGMPFGPRSQESGQMVNRIRSSVKVHYGHAGYKLIHHLTNNMGSLPELKSQYQKYCEQFAKEASSSIEDRMFQYLAVCAVASDLFHKVVDLPWKPGTAMKVMVDAIRINAAELPIGVRAMKDTIGWAYSNQSRFGHSFLDGTPNPMYGVWNRYRKKDGPFGQKLQKDEMEINPNWECLFIISTVLKEYLEKQGYSFEAVIRSWKANGWLLTAKDRHDKQVTFKGFQYWGIAIKPEAFGAVGMDSESEEQRKAREELFACDDDFTEPIFNE